MLEQNLGPGSVWTISLSLSRVLEHLNSLSKEVNLDYERSMNKINFDRIVSSKPETFFYVTLPKKEVEKVPQQGEGPVDTHLLRPLLGWLFCAQLFSPNLSPHSFAFPTNGRIGQR